MGGAQGKNLGREGVRETQGEGLLGKKGGVQILRCFTSRVVRGGVGHRKRAGVGFGRSLGGRELSNFRLAADSRGGGGGG